MLCPGTNPLEAMVTTSVLLRARLVWILPISYPSSITRSRLHQPPKVFTFRPGSILNLALIACFMVIATTFEFFFLLRGCPKIYENRGIMSRSIFDSHFLIIFLTIQPFSPRIFEGFSITEGKAFDTDRNPELIKGG